MCVCVLFEAKKKCVEENNEINSRTGRIQDPMPGSLLHPIIVWLPHKSQQTQR